MLHYDLLNNDTKKCNAEKGNHFDQGKPHELHENEPYTH
jgi:hypothetical protein